MKNRNELIKIFREICGEETDNGYFLKFDDLKVPNYVDKDEPVEYPEIRITPFLSDKEESKREKKISTYQKIVKEVYKGRFQVDIFSKSTTQVNTIYQELYNRINDFIKPDIITYDYDKEYTEYKDDYYLNENYNQENSVLNEILIENTYLDRVSNFNELYNDSWYLGKKGLYIKTDKDITTLKIKYMIDGLVFPDGESAASKCLYKASITGYMYSSQSEKNEVKRITFDVPLTYEIHRKYKLGPVIEEIEF